MRFSSGISFGLLAVFLTTACSKTESAKPAASEAGTTDSVQAPPKTDDSKASTPPDTSKPAEPEGPKVASYSLSKNAAGVGYCQSYEISGAHTVLELDALLNASPAVRPVAAQPTPDPMMGAMHEGPHNEVNYSTDFTLEKKAESCGEKLSKPAGGYCKWTLKKELSGGSATLQSNQYVFWSDLGLLIQVGQSEQSLSTAKKELESLQYSIKLAEDNVTKLQMQLDLLNMTSPGSAQALLLAGQLASASASLSDMKAQESVLLQSIQAQESALAAQQASLKTARDALKASCKASELDLTSAEWVEM